ncbi:hypothetical protein EW145_g178 [Phellinidium pouzarii]|uniref:Uncharacterized protein n=1 Tax=Phellinidium pouzarii TaxID=167371 RepID=A0A4S4LK12_9AGAM|nr:hypothetical protein EW145_g178 [Phellinidium pouzarii]
MAQLDNAAALTAENTPVMDAQAAAEVSHDNASLEGDAPKRSDGAVEQQNGNAEDTAPLQGKAIKPITTKKGTFSKVVSYRSMSSTSTDAVKDTEETYMPKTADVTAPEDAEPTGNDKRETEPTIKTLDDEHDDAPSQPYGISSVML